LPASNRLLGGIKISYFEIRKVAASLIYGARVVILFPDEKNGCYQADFLCGGANGITFPFCSGAIHLIAFFRKLLGM
jgi:hypothetical protein